MRTICLTIAYEGTNYAGWQVQPDQASVQGAIEVALKTVTGESIRIHGAGRTDAGVHAFGQVAHFTTAASIPTDKFAAALNSELPRDIIVRASIEVPDGFHARFSAVRKQYRYLIDTADRTPPWLRHLVWRVPGELDDEALAAAGQRLVGPHDFSAFETKSSPDEDSTRTVSAIEVERTPSAFGWPHANELLSISITADGFLYNMVRTIVGTIVKVGQRQWTADDVSKILESRDRSQAGPTAPPQGLSLMWVDYDGVDVSGADVLSHRPDMREVTP